MKTSLPNELLHFIVAHVADKDKPALARVCSRLLAVTREHIYKHLSIEGGGTSDETYTLLRNPSIAQYVEVVKISGVYIGQRLPSHAFDVIGTILESHPWAPLDIFKHMRNLRSVKFDHGATFGTADYQHEFAQIIKEYCPNVKALQFDTPLLHGDEFDVVNLETLAWNCTCQYKHFYYNLPHGPHSSSTDPFSRPIMFDLLQKSLTTLTTLSILPSIMEEGAQLLKRFASLRFPRLQSLTIGPWYDLETEGPKMARCFTTFLLCHPLLEKFQVEFAEITDFEPDPCLHPATMTKDMLPNLQSLTGHQSFVLILAQQNCQCLLKLKSLRLWHSWGEPLQDSLAAMLDALKSTGGLPNLKSYCEINDDMEIVYDSFLKRMMDLAGVCPALETWSGKTYEDATEVK